MSLIAFAPQLDRSGLWSAQIDREEPCPGASRVLTLPDTVTLAWGEPHALPDLVGLAAAVRSGGAAPLPGCSWIHLDRRTGRVEAGVDRYGAFPILVREDRPVPVLANHPLAMARVLGSGAEVDEEAVIEVLGLGQPIGQRSSLRGVRHLPANAHGTWEGRARTLAAPTLRLGEGPRATRREALDALVAAVDRRMRAAPGAMLPLSGGLDSRLILAAALAGGHRPDCLVYGSRDSADVILARDLANAAGLRLDVGLFHPAGVRSAARTIAEMGGGLVPLQHGYGLYDAALVARTRGRPLLTGTGAETFRAFYWNRGMPGCGLLGLAAWRARTRETAARWAREHFARTLAPLAQVAPEVGAALRADLEALIRRTLAGAPDSAHGLDALYLGERVRRFVIGGQQLLDRDYARLHPFLDPEVVDGLSRLAPVERLHARFQRWAVHRLAPGLAEVRWDVTMRPMRDGLTWRERWPGLADRIGAQGCWGKRGRSMLCDPDHLLPMASDSPDLSPALAGLGARLAQASGGHHATGAIGAWTLWLSALRDLRQRASMRLVA